MKSKIGKPKKSEKFTCYGTHGGHDRNRCEVFESKIPHQIRLLQVVSSLIVIREAGSIGVNRTKYSVCQWNLFGIFLRGQRRKQMANSGLNSTYRMMYRLFLSIGQIGVELNAETMGVIESMQGSVPKPAKRFVRAERMTMLQFRQMPPLIWFNDHELHQMLFLRSRNFICPVSNKIFSSLPFLISISNISRVIQRRGC